jgi:CheY-like chemotaxis protein
MGRTDSSRVRSSFVRCGLVLDPPPIPSSASRLPRSFQPEPPTVSTASSELALDARCDSATPLPSLKVLVAEDSALIRERLAGLLSELPQVEIVGEASDGSSALRLFFVCRPRAVILDIQMPGPNGIEVLRQIKAEDRNCVVIILTSYQQPEFRGRCAEAGADFFFHKSTEFEKVLVVLNDLITTGLPGGSEA